MGDSDVTDVMRMVVGPGVDCPSVVGGEVAVDGGAFDPSKMGGEEVSNGVVGVVGGVESP